MNIFVGQYQKKGMTDNVKGNEIHSVEWAESRVWAQASTEGVKYKNGRVLALILYMRTNQILTCQSFVLTG